ncbi:hypothetical protein [Massilia sp. S19_KUP03_FR1]|uniref:hypothetical protein n=1 Tax=Massilia sp. S19_KUP03_FR1 TaxID=3025503 RepID=UPI002FCDA3F1
MLSPAFAAALDLRRAWFNARVAQARAREPGFDVDAFARFLADCVDPLVRVVPQNVEAVAEAAFDIALVLCRQRPDDVAAQVWTRLAPAYGALVARAPHETLGLLVNAVARLQALPNARPAQWLERMLALAPQVTSTHALRGVGLVLAWRAGAAHFRAGAIDAADGLAPALALAAFGAGPSWPALRAELARNPWWHAPGDGAPEQELGAFIGLNGMFAQPPEVRSCHDGFMVASADRHFLLVADACGAVLLAASRDEFDAAAEGGYPELASFEDSTLVTGARRVLLDLPATGLRACCNASLVAVTSPYTHAIRVLPLR